MLLDDDVVTDGKTEPSTFPGRLGRKERVEQLFLNLRRDPGAVVAYPDFDLVTEALGRHSERRLVVAYFPFERGTPRKRPALEWYRILLLIFYEIAGKSMSRRKMKEIAKPPVDKSKIRLAQPGGGFDERIEDRL